MDESALDKFSIALDESLKRETFVKLTLAKYRGSEAGLKNVYVRPVLIRRRPHLSFSFRYETKDIVNNHPLHEGRERVCEMLGADFLSGHLFTLESDLQIEFNRRREARLVSRPPTFTELPPAEHDRRKQHAMKPDDALWLRELGITNERGEVRPAMGGKLRQINKFVEIIADLHASSALAGEGKISVVDMGAGKGYLTFAVYDLFNRTLGVEAEVVGVEARADLVEKTNAAASRARFDRLSFERGFIEDYELARTDILIALHACDTATDDALFKGVRARASIIVAAPCCHKEVRPQISAPEPLRKILRHGTFLEREAETLTDALRALLLEAAGYKVKVFEFISTEHTHKNTMITGVKRADDARDSSAMTEYIALKEFFGIREQRLEKLLRGISLI